MQLVPLHFALWAGYEERARDGEKYVLGERTQRQHARAAAAGADDGGGGGGDGAPALEW